MFQRWYIAHNSMQLRYIPVILPLLILPDIRRGKGKNTARCSHCILARRTPWNTRILNYNLQISQAKGSCNIYTACNKSVLVGLHKMNR